MGEIFGQLMSVWAFNVTHSLGLYFFTIPELFRLGRIGIPDSRRILCKSQSRFAVGFSPMRVKDADV